MTSLPDVPTTVALRSRLIRDPAPAEEPTTSRPERMMARTMPVTRTTFARILRARLIAPSVRSLGASLTPEQSRRERAAALELGDLRRADVEHHGVAVQLAGHGAREAATLRRDDRERVDLPRRLAAQVYRRNDQGQDRRVTVRHPIHHN